MESKLSIFNLQIDNFFKDLLNIFPENKKLKTSYEKFKLLKSVNVRKTYNLFMTHVYQYRNQIQKHDDSFFNDKLTCLDSNTTGINDLFDIKELWENNMSDKEKGVVWDYFNVLIVLAEKV